MTSHDLLTPEEESTLRTHYHNRYEKSPAVATTLAGLASRMASQPQKLPWWKTLFSRVPTYKGVQPARRFSLRSPIAIALMLLALLVGTATTYAAFNFETLAQALGFQFSVPAAQGGHDTPIHQQKTVNGITITVEKASINSKSIIIGYTTTQSLKSTFSASTPVLTVVQGTTSTTLHEGVGDKIPVHTQDGKDGNSYTAYYSKAPFQHASQDLKMHLVMSVTGQGNEPAQTVSFDFTVPAS